MTKRDPYCEHHFNYLPEVTYEKGWPGAAITIVGKNGERPGWYRCTEGCGLTVKASEYKIKHVLVRRKKNEYE